MSQSLLLAANTLPNPRLSLILLCKNTSSNQDMQCKVLAIKNIKIWKNSGQNLILNINHYRNKKFDWIVTDVNNLYFNLINW